MVKYSLKLQLQAKFTVTAQVYEHKLISNSRINDFKLQVNEKKRQLPLKSKLQLPASLSGEDVSASLKPGPATRDVTARPPSHWRRARGAWPTPTEATNQKRERSPCGNHVSAPPVTRKQTGKVRKPGPKLS